jgi:hypothetical protein
MIIKTKSALVLTFSSRKGYFPLAVSPSLCEKGLLGLITQVAFLFSRRGAKALSAGLAL